MCSRGVGCTQAREVEKKTEEGSHQDKKKKMAIVPPFKEKKKEEGSQQDKKKTAIVPPFKEKKRRRASSR